MIRVPSNQICLEIWESGYDLLTYLVAGGDPDLASNYRKACSKMLASMEDKADLSKVLETAASLNQADIDYLEHKHCIVRYHPDGQWPDDNPIFDLLEAGALIGFGFIHPRRPQDYPQPIPSDVWNRFADAWQSSVGGNGIEFVAVRVASMSRYTELLASSGLARSEKQVGRPSVAEKVREAFEALCAAKIIDGSGALSKTYQPIRDWLSQNYPENALQFSKLAGETIRRVITDDFKVMDKNNKQ